MCGVVDFVGVRCGVCSLVPFGGVLWGGARGSHSLNSYKPGCKTIILLMFALPSSFVIQRQRHTAFTRTPSAHGGADIYRRPAPGVHASSVLYL